MIPASKYHIEAYIVVSGFQMLPLQGHQAVIILLGSLEWSIQAIFQDQSCCLLRMKIVMGGSSKLASTSSFVIFSSFTIFILMPEIGLKYLVCEYYNLLNNYSYTSHIAKYVDINPYPKQLWDIIDFDILWMANSVSIVSLYGKCYSLCMVERLKLSSVHVIISVS